MPSCQAALGRLKGMIMLLHRRIGCIPIDYTQAFHCGQAAQFTFLIIIMDDYHHHHMA
jgi:hypothetical protein